MTPSAVTVAGGGPAGVSAALAAVGTGARVTLYEKARFPRHKVCGEFLSPEAAEVLDDLGVWSPLASAGAVPIRRISILLNRREIRHQLLDPAWGISRYAMDAALLGAAGGSCDLRRRSVLAPTPPAVIAWGRSQRPPVECRRGDRQFGFKAHFAGPATDGVELYFFNGCYAGVSPVEGGRTNVCALAPLHLLEREGFDFDEVLRSHRPLRRRLAPLARCTRWFTTGPVTFGLTAASGVEGIYRAGDALGFLDPFTGAGMTTAILTGRLAGLAAARRTPVREYQDGCRRISARSFRVAGWLRRIASGGWAPRLAPLAPAGWLFRATRPRVLPHLL